MPFSASDLSWWGWLLVAVACGVVATIVLAFGHRSRVSDGDRWVFTLIGFVPAAAGCFFVLIAVIRLIKWISEG
jgi:hypothetical protein